jgi:sugar phosphate isomerase/epimerase
MHTLSLSTCWNSERHSDGYDLLRECSELGFSAAELSHGIKLSLLPGIERAVKEKLITISSIHNFFPLPVGFNHAAPNAYEFTDTRPTKHMMALKLTLKTLEHASELGTTAIVLHTGSTGRSGIERKLKRLIKGGRMFSRQYIDLKLRAVQRHEKIFAQHQTLMMESLQKIADRAKELGISIGLECRESVDEVPLDDYWDQIFSQLPDHIGYWHDTGHAMRKEALGFIDALSQLKKWKSRLKGIHIHDFQYLDKDHLPIGEGIIPWEVYKKEIPDEIPIVLELSPSTPSEKVKKCLQNWKENPERSIGAFGSV